jgi:hypothetical protein
MRKMPRTSVRGTPGKGDAASPFWLSQANATVARTFRRRMAVPIAPKPTSIYAHVVGSGTAPTAADVARTSDEPPWLIALTR